MPVDDPSPSETPPSTILVIEPDILVRMTIADYLRECGYRVFEGATADDVVTVLGTEHKVDVIFAEVQLSGSMDGFSLAQWVREKHPRVDVILTSGIAKAAEQAADLCDEGPLDKPYHPQEVVRRINILLERRRTGPHA
jgi:DNA-binding response OmpR family regulator